jgi:hypothetical protein
MIETPLVADLIESEGIGLDTLGLPLTFDNATIGPNSRSRALISMKNTTTSPKLMHHRGHQERNA